MRTVFRETLLRLFLLHCVCSLFLCLFSNDDILFCRVTAQSTQVTVQSIKQELEDASNTAIEALKKATQAQGNAQTSQVGDVKRAKDKHEEAKKLGQGVDDVGGALTKAQSELKKAEEEHAKAVKAANEAFNKVERAENQRDGRMREFDTRFKHHSNNVNQFLDLRTVATKTQENAAEADVLTKQANEAIGLAKRAADNVEVAVYEVKARVAAKKITQTQSTINNYLLNVDTLKSSAEQSQDELGKSLTDVSNELRESVKTKQDTMSEALKEETEEKKRIQEVKTKLEDSKSAADGYVKSIAAESALDRAKETYENAETALKTAESLQETASASFTKIKSTLETALLESSKAVAIVASAKTAAFAKTAREHATMVAEERKKAEATVASIQSAQNGAIDAAAQVVSAQLQIAQAALNALKQKEAEIEALASAAEKQKTDAESALAAVEKATSYTEAQTKVVGATNAEKIAEKKNEEAKSALDQIALDVEKIERAMHKTTAVCKSSKAAASRTRVNDYVTQATQKEEEARKALAYIKDIQTKVPDSGAAQGLAKVAVGEELLTAIKQNVKDVESAKHKAEMHRTTAEDILAKLKNSNDDTSDAKDLSDQATEAAANAEKNEAEMKSSFEQLSANLISLTTTKHEAVSILALAETDLYKTQIDEYAVQITKKREGAREHCDEIRKSLNTAPNDVKQHLSTQVQIAEESLKIILQKYEETEKLAQEADEGNRDAETSFSTEKQTASADEADKQAVRVTQLAAIVKAKEEQAKRNLDEVATEAEKVEMAMHRTTAIVASANTVLSAARTREYATQAKVMEREAHVNVESVKSAQKDAPSDAQIAVSGTVAQAEESLKTILEKCEESERLVQEAENERKKAESIVSTAEQTTSVESARADAVNVTQIAATVKAKEEQAKHNLDEVAKEAERVEMAMHRTTVIVASANTVLSAVKAREYATQAKVMEREAHVNVESVKSAQKDAPSDVRKSVEDNLAQAEESLGIIVDSAKTSDRAANEAEVQKQVSESLVAELQKQDRGVNDGKDLSEKCNTTSAAAAAQETLAHSAFSQIVVECERIKKIVQKTTAVIASAAKKPVDMPVLEVDNGVGDNESYDNISEDFAEIYTFEF